MFVNRINFFSKCRRILYHRYLSSVGIEDSKDNLEHVGFKLNDYIQKEKMKAYEREYRIQNKDKIKEAKREYYIQNKGKMNKYNQEYCLQNKEKRKEYHREYSIQNKEKKKESNRDYYIQNKDKLKEYVREYYQKSNKKKEYNREYSKNFVIKKNIERNNGQYVPFKSWKNNESIREYFEQIAPLLHISDLSDWYRISRKQIIDLKGSRMFALFNSLGEALKEAYPDYDWDMSKFSLRGKKSSQRWLCVKLKKLLPNITIEEEYNHPELLWEEKTNKIKSMQLDIWVSQYNLALEYQGEHHYFDIPSAYGPGSTTQIFNERDEKKKLLCASKGIHLVCIPYWWDGHEDSLSSTLHAILPTVFHKTDSPPIPSNLPNDHAKDNAKS